MDCSPPGSSVHAHSPGKNTGVSFHAFLQESRVVCKCAKEFEKIGEGNGTPLQYSCLENPMDEEPGGLQSMGSSSSDYLAAIKQTVEKAMATHSSTLAWRIPWAEEPGRLQSRGS